MVIDVPGISESCKLLHLQDKLTGEAGESIKFTQPTDFVGMWKDLEACYRNPRIILSAHIRNLFSITPAQKSSRPTPLPEMKRLIDTFRQ